MSEIVKTTVVSYFSEELLTEILKRLPVKHILRCTCVQKSWCRLIHSSYFISLHSRHQSKFNKYLLFHNRTARELYFSLRYDDEQCKEHCELRLPQDVHAYFQSRGAVVYETCNGLICLSATRMHKVWLWNPAIRVLRVLPGSPFPTDGSLIQPITGGLVFGYLAKTNDYKVIKYEHCIGDGGGLEYFAYVYSLSTDSWKTVKKAGFGGFSINKLSNSVVVNGVAYWVGSMQRVREGEKVIVCFDMENDNFREIMLPPPYSKKNAESVALVGNSMFRELLSLFYHDRTTSVVHIWVLENAGEPDEAWSKKTSVDFDQRWQPLSFRNNGKIVLRARGAKKFLSYDLEKNEAKDIVDDHSLDTFHWSGDRYPHPHQGVNRLEENLVLLDVNRQAKIHKVSPRSGTSMEAGHII